MNQLTKVNDFFSNLSDTKLWLSISIAVLAYKLIAVISGHPLYSLVGYFIIIYLTPLSEKPKKIPRLFLMITFLIYAIILMKIGFPFLSIIAFIAVLITCPYKNFFHNDFGECEEKKSAPETK